MELFQHSNSALPYAGLADAYLVLDSWTVEAVPPIEKAWRPAGGQPHATIGPGERS